MANNKRNSWQLVLLCHCVSAVFLMPHSLLCGVTAISLKMCKSSIRLLSFHKEFSNTLALERAGWDGLCIEPNPAYWYGLSHRKCKVAGALVGATKEKVQVKFRGVYGGIVGKLDERLANRKREPNAPVEERYTAPLIELLQKFDVPPTIDYLSLDVEGAEYLIMKDFPFNQYSIKVMTVERPNKELRALFEKENFVFLKDLAWWGETLWAHKSTGFTPTHPKVVSIKTETPQK